MSTPMTVRLIGPDPQHRYAPLVASLPVTLRPTGGSADLVIVFDAGAVTEAASVATEAIVFADPMAADLKRLTADTAVPVHVSETYAGSVALTDYLDACSQLPAEPATLLELRADGVRPDESFEDVLFQLLRVANAAGEPLTPATITTLGSAAVVVDGTAHDQAPFTVTASRSPAPRRVELIRHTATGALSIMLPDSSTARPAVVKVLDPSGSRVVPTRYETALRATIQSIASDRGQIPNHEQQVIAAQRAISLMHPAL